MQFLSLFALPKICPKLSYFLILQIKINKRREFWKKVKWDGKQRYTVLKYSIFIVFA